NVKQDCPLLSLVPCFTLIAIVARYNKEATMRTLLSIAACLLPISLLAADTDPAKVFPPDEKCPDSRLGEPKQLKGYFPFTPPKTKEGWNDRARQVREQLLVANGLWPLLE